MLEISTGKEWLFMSSYATIMTKSNNVVQGALGQRSTAPEGK